MAAIQLIGGHVEDGETFRECAIREAEEELRLKHGIDFTVSANSIGRCTRVAFSVSAQQEAGYQFHIFAGDAVSVLFEDRIRNDSANRWLSRLKSFVQLTCDGHAISDTMAFVLSELSRPFFITLPPRPMKRRIFTSPVSSEFKTTPQTVANIIRRLGYEPVMQEIFGTEPGDLRHILIPAA